MMRANNMRVVLGSALLWAWGFLCFLSPALFPERGGLDASIGLEYGFFASQASVLVCAGVVVLVSRWRRFIVKRGAFFVAALLVCADYACADVGGARGCAGRNRGLRGD